MPNILKYLVDSNGQRTSVLVPIKLWEELNANYEALQKKVEVLKDIQSGLNEVKQAKASGNKLQSLNDFLK